MNEITKIAIFKGQKVRKITHNNEWWFVVEEIVVALTDSPNPKDYMNKMRLRDSELSKATFGMTPSQYKKFKNLKREKG